MGEVAGRRGGLIKELDGFAGILTDLRRVFLQDVESFQG